MWPNIDNSFIGGNGELLEIDLHSNTIIMRPEIKGGSPHRGWFNARIDNLIPNKRYCLRVIQNCWAGIYSYYNIGDSCWTHFTDYHKDNNTNYTFHFTPMFDKLHIAMMPPYLLSNLDRLIRDIYKKDTLNTEDFWTSENGRFGKVISIGNSSASFCIWITARLHAFEAVSSWVAEGLIRWLLSNDPYAYWLTKNCIINIVPIVDIDSVCVGSSGKHRNPVDFARDACETPYWNFTKNLLRLFDQEGPPDIFIDLHGPHGKENDIFVYAPPKVYNSAKYDSNLNNYCDILSKLMPTGIEFNRRIWYCPLEPDECGQYMTNTIYSYLQRKYYGRSRLKLAIGIETPWSLLNYNIDMFLSCGALYGKTISHYLQNMI